MSAKEAQTMRRLIDSIKNADRGKTSGYDTTATVRRIEDGTAWVHIPGGVDETPVKLTIAAAPGDQVQVRVSGGRAFLVGNATAPPTDDTTARAAVKQIGAVSKVVKTVQRIAEQAARIAGNTNQYFWHTESGTDTGAHITEIPQEAFLRDPESGGGNLLARSNGIAVRNGLDELASFSASGMSIELPDGYADQTAGVSFTRGGVRKSRLWSSGQDGDWVVVEGADPTLYGSSVAHIYAPIVTIGHNQPVSPHDQGDCEVYISGTLDATNHKVGCVNTDTNLGWTWYKYDDGSFDLYRRVSVTLTSYATSGGFNAYYTDLQFPDGCTPNSALYQVFHDWQIGTGFSMSAGTMQTTTTGFRLYGLGSASGQQTCVINVHVHGTYQ